jgi:NAD(P)-dependent dehydrogenase (short-subunit alcohol dehydrogenase family)
VNRVQGKVVVVTGASSGFGRGIAKALAAEGAKVVVSDVRESPNAGGFEDDAALTTVEAIQKAGGRARYVSCDVTKADQVEALVAAAVAEFGRLDVFVNNAGIYRNGKRLHEFTEADLDVCFDVNAKGTFFGAQSAVRQFLAQGDGGVIINLVSTAGLQGHPPAFRLCPQAPPRLPLRSLLRTWSSQLRQSSTLAVSRSRPSRTASARAPDSPRTQARRASGAFCRRTGGPGSPLLQRQYRTRGNT